MKVISDKLQWLNAKDQRQMEWLTKQLKKNYDMGTFVEYYKCENDSSFLKLLIEEWELESKRNPKQINHDIGRLKNAWNNYNKKNKSTSFSLSSEARNHLAEIASRWNQPRNKVIEELILQEQNFVESPSTSKSNDSEELLEIKGQIQAINDFLFSELKPLMDELKKSKSESSPSHQTVETSIEPSKEKSSESIEKHDIKSSKDDETNTLITPNNDRAIPCSAEAYFEPFINLKPEYFQAIYTMNHALKK